MDPKIIDHYNDYIHGDMPRRSFLKRVAEIAGSATAAAAILPIQRDAEPLGIKNVIEAQYDRDGLERMGPLRTLLERGIPFHIEGQSPGTIEIIRPGLCRGL